MSWLPGTWLQQQERLFFIYVCPFEKGSGSSVLGDDMVIMMVRIIKQRGVFIHSQHVHNQPWAYSLRKSYLVREDNDDNSHICAKY